LLGAMVHVLRHDPRAKLLLVVTVPNPKHERVLREEADRLGIANNIVWIKPTAMDDALRILPACDIAVVPRPCAPGFPIKLLNYMASRRPCAMFRSSASGVTHGEHVWLADNDTSESLADGLIRLMQDGMLRAHIGAGAYGFVCQHHDRRGVAAELCQAYLRLLQGSKQWRRVLERNGSSEWEWEDYQEAVAAFQETGCLEAVADATA
jgi:1,2-diacylglycerol 3-alpha-glucosyltransferase